jgi:opacity protein-like surface antigen
VFGEGGYGWFSANQSFNAVLGKSGGLWYGGGLQYDFASRYRMEAGAEHFQATGQRVFIFNGTTYALGITDRLKVTPIMGTAAVRFPNRSFDLYVGGGAGVYLFNESSDFAESSDNVSEAKAAYRALGGVQWRLARKYSAALEVRYTTVPSAFSGGTAAALNESNLGGLHITGKFLFGR